MLILRRLLLRQTKFIQVSATSIVALFLATVATAIADEPAAFVTDSWQWDWDRLQSKIVEMQANPPTVDPRDDPHMLDVQTLVWPSDRDPLDVELRRARALVEHLKASVHGGFLKDAEKRLSAIANDAERVTPNDDTNAAERKSLYFRARAVRRRVALSNPLLDFDEIFFVTGKLLGAHIQTHFRATHSTAPGDLYRLANFRSDAPRIESVLRNARLVNGRHAGEPIEDGAFQTLDLSFDGQTLLFDWCARREPEDLGPDTIFNPAHFALDNTFNIYSLDLDSGELLQLTDTRYNDAAPCWLPDWRVAFISDRREIHVRCHPDTGSDQGKHQRNLQTCASLFSMKADGSDIFATSPHDWDRCPAGRWVTASTPRISGQARTN